MQLSELRDLTQDALKSLSFDKDLKINIGEATLSINFHAGQIHAMVSKILNQESSVSMEKEEAAQLIAKILIYTDMLAMFFKLDISDVISKHGAKIVNEDLR